MPEPCAPGKGEAPQGAGLQRGHVSDEMNKDEVQEMGVVVSECALSPSPWLQWLFIYRENGRQSHLPKEREGS